MFLSFFKVVPVQNQFDELEKDLTNEVTFLDFIQVEVLPQNLLSGSKIFCEFCEKM